MEGAPDEEEERGVLKAVERALPEEGVVSSGQTTGAGLGRMNAKSSRWSGEEKGLAGQAESEQW